MEAGATAFDLDALYEALDAERRARGMTWSGVTREINALFEDVPCRPIASSTITGLRGKRSVNGNGVLQMLVWLERTPESFARSGDGSPAPAGLPLPRLRTDRILRFDARAIHRALDEARAKRAMTWRQVAKEIGEPNAAALTRLAKGGIVCFPAVMGIARWLGRPVSALTVASPV